jgi:hypothetical protein
VLRRRRKNTRKVAKLARALAALEDQARHGRSSSRRSAKISIGLF